jgi:hypothetical protein
LSASCFPSLFVATNPSASPILLSFCTPLTQRLPSHPLFLKPMPVIYIRCLPSIWELCCLCKLLLIAYNY